MLMWPAGGILADAWVASTQTSQAATVRGADAKPKLPLPIPGIVNLDTIKNPTFLL